MTLHIPFDNSYARLPEGFAAHMAPTPVSDPSLIAWNAPLAAQLGITGQDDLAQIFSGNRLPEGADPLAQLYAGHQFGQYNPQLGDGRALLLGEVIDQSGQRRDIQLKGSGPTPFSRRGDGRAALGPVLREYIVSEAMHALGVPTTRALAAVRTGDIVLREAPLPGAILTRVASSHIRVGTFQVFAASRQEAELRTLYEHTAARHDPKARDPHEMLDGVIARQADLIAHWMSLGFIHGVMNTDNCTLSGETIDYGPCAFMDGYDPEAVFSSIDRYGRYAYSAQADIIVWNMAQLATALVPLLPDTDAAVARFTEQVHAMPQLIRDAWLARFAAKIGISTPRATDPALIADLLDLMQGGPDFTNTFRALAEDPKSVRDQVLDRAGFDDWAARWQDRLADETDPQTLMRQVNPARIPRNHRIQEAITAAQEGDDAPFHALHAALATPYDDDPSLDAYRAPPREDQIVRATFCGT